MIERGERRNGTRRPASAAIVTSSAHRGFRACSLRLQADSGREQASIPSDHAQTSFSAFQQGDVALSPSRCSPRGSYQPWSADCKTGFGPIGCLAAIGMTLPFAVSAATTRSRSPSWCARRTWPRWPSGRLPRLRGRARRLADHPLLPRRLSERAPASCVLGMTVTAFAGNWLPLQQPATFWNAVAIDGMLAACLLAGLWVRQMHPGATLEQLAAQLEQEHDGARAAVAEGGHGSPATAPRRGGPRHRRHRSPSRRRRGCPRPRPRPRRVPLVAIRSTARGALADVRRVLRRPAQRPLRPTLAPDPGLARIGPLIERSIAAGLSVDGAKPRHCPSTARRRWRTSPPTAWCRRRA